LEAFCLALSLEVLAGAGIVVAVRHYRPPTLYQLQQTAHRKAARPMAMEFGVHKSKNTASRATYRWWIGGPPSQDVLVKELQKAPGQ
jgi:hypothetical protein